MVIGDIEVIKSFLENYLLKNLESIKKFDNLVIESPIFINNDLREFIGDMLCRVSLNEEIEIYFLIEHKSYIDRNISLQLLEYMAKKLEKLLELMRDKKSSAGIWKIL